MKKVSIFLIANLVAINFVFSQNGVSINTTGAAANSSAMLDVSSTTKGILIPRITEAQKLSIVNPAMGLLIYQTDNIIGFWYYDTSIPAWVQAIGPQGQQGIQGVTGIDGATGVTGSTGASGTNGTNGATGAASTVPGPTGPTGTNGTNGANSTVPGPTGATGSQGTQGIQGIIGATGSQGIQGATGSTGAAGSTGITGSTGPLVAGTSGQTLRHDGTGWIANSVLFNDGANVGVGTASSGAKLEVAGQVKITGGSPGTQKVLTSDAGGLGSWKSLSGGGSTGCATCITSISIYEGSSLTWVECADACYNLVEGGFSDWRIPTWDEAVYYRTTFGPPDGTWIADYVWTSTPWDSRVAATPSAGTWVLFPENNGGWSSANYATTYCCRCVR